jgi:PAS domain S-box-containing protein
MVTDMYPEAALESISIIDLAKEYQLLQTIIERSFSGIAVFKKDRFVFTNTAFQNILGLSADEVLRANPFDTVHPDDRELVEQRAEQRLKGLSPPDDYEFRIIAADGRIKWVRLLSAQITFQGEPAILANVLDIDAQKRAQDIRRETERLRTILLDSLPHPSMLVRKDRVILAANRLAQEMGIRVGEDCCSEFCKRSFQDGTRKPEAPGLRAACRADEAMETGEPRDARSVEVGGRLWDVFWIPVEKDAYLHYAIDVTKQREIEEAIRASEERYRLITDTMTDGLSIQDRQGVIVQVNNRLCQITGLTRKELIGRRLPDLFASSANLPEDWCFAACDRPQSVLERFLNHKDGRKIAVSMKSNPLVGDDGQPKGSFVFFSDISEVRKLRRLSVASHIFADMVGSEPCMRKLFKEISDVADCDFPVLIQGESGVGKELAAQAIHNQSHRAERMFVPVNCAALPEGLIESELFGHAKGAFTGASRDKKGRFELADGGTIFLDEVAELSPAMQVKLLRVLQEGAFERLGDLQTIQVDVRIISATNKDLEHEMHAGRFRRDLYYRLCVMPLLVPPLRERKNDIPLLADHFIKNVAGKKADGRQALSPEALLTLIAYDWPGNVRELQNTIKYAYVKCKGTVIEPVHLPAGLRALPAQPARPRKRQRKLAPEKVRDALRRTGGNKARAARMLGVSRVTLYRFLADADI